jgi:poly(A) polymerase
MDIDAQIPSQVPVPQPAEDLPSYLEACGIPEEDPGLASAATASLVAFLDAAAPLESTDERKEREYLLEGLKGALLEWVREMAVAKGLFPDVEAAAEEGVTAQLLVSGSYRLGFNDRDGDIDTVCLCPSFVEVDDFFGAWVDKLSAYPGLEHLNALRSATVPIIELDVGGISVDIGFSRLHRPTVPASLNILDDAVLAGMDIKDIRAINGPRVTTMVYKLATPPIVPGGSFSTFVVVVRALRLWARRRGVYSNKHGFLGGVNLNILAAWGVQRFPAAAPARVLHLLFRALLEHPWPNPIFVNTTVYKASDANNATAEEMVWEAARNLRHVMPLLTPAYPVSNSSFSVSRSTLNVMLGEFDRAQLICEELLGGGAGGWGAAAGGSGGGAAGGGAPDWAALFAPSDFFLRFPYYLAVTMADSALGPLPAWKDRVNAVVPRLIRLVRQLEAGGGKGMVPGQASHLAAVFPCVHTFFEEAEKEVPAGAEEGAEVAGAGDGTVAAVVAAAVEAGARPSPPPPAATEASDGGGAERAAAGSEGRGEIAVEAPTPTLAAPMPPPPPPPPAPVGAATIEAAPEKAVKVEAAAEGGGAAAAGEAGARAPPLPGVETAEPAPPAPLGPALCAVLTGAARAPLATATRRVHTATLYIGIEPPANTSKLVLAPQMKAWADETREFLKDDPAVLAFKSYKWEALPEAVFRTPGGRWFEGSRDAARAARAALKEEKKRLESLQASQIAARQAQLDVLVSSKKYVAPGGAAAAEKGKPPPAGGKPPAPPRDAAAAAPSPSPAGAAAPSPVPAASPLPTPAGSATDAARAALPKMPPPPPSGLARPAAAPLPPTPAASAAAAAAAAAPALAAAPAPAAAAAGKKRDASAAAPAAGAPAPAPAAGRVVLAAPPPPAQPAPKKFKVAL